MVACQGLVMVKCVTSKRSYPTIELAEEALIEARTQFDFTPGHGPVAVYRCDDCGYYHLTSKGLMSEKLQKMLANGDIGRQKEANRWLDKIKRK